MNILLLGLVLYSYFVSSAPKFFKENKQIVLGIFIGVTIYQMNLVEGIDGGQSVSIHSCLDIIPDRCRPELYNENDTGCMVNRDTDPRKCVAGCNNEQTAIDNECFTFTACELAQRKCDDDEECTKLMNDPDAKDEDCTNNDLCKQVMTEC
jgi:hypothetical protein